MLRESLDEAKGRLSQQPQTHQDLDPTPKPIRPGLQRGRPSQPPRFFKSFRVILLCKGSWKATAKTLTFPIP